MPHTPSTQKQGTRAEHKKAVLFTLIAVLFSALFIGLFSYAFTASVDQSIPSTNVRIKVIDSYVRNFEKYAKDSMKISAYRTLESLQNDRVAAGVFFADRTVFDARFSQCISCGKVDCANLLAADCSAPLVTATDRYDMQTLLDKIANLSNNNLNINTTYSVHSINVTQLYPFELQVTMNISYNISDQNDINYARWEKTVIIVESVDITGLTDPLESISTGGVYRKHIAWYPYCRFNDSCWNITHVQAIYSNTSFIYFQNGTSYLQRFWNASNSSECCGIEGFINSTYGNFHNTSFVDHYYWNNTYYCDGPGDDSILRFDMVDVGFMLDEISASRFNIAQEGVVVCPE